MAFALGLPVLEHGQRPALFRSRSHTIPSDQQPLSEPQSAITSTPTKSKRPSHFRSISYVSLEEAKPRNSSTALADSDRPVPSEKEREKHHRIHLPGSKHHNRERDNERDDTSRRKHRHTQSDVHTNSRPAKNKSRDDSTLPNLVAGLSAERYKRAYALANSTSRYNPNYHNTDIDPSSAVPGNLSRIRTSNSHRHPHSRGNSSSHFNPAGDAMFGSYYHGEPYGRAMDDLLHRRATSDPKQPFSQSPKTQLEIDLDRADRLRQRKKTHVTAQDLVRRDKEIDQAESELRDRVATINRSAMEITRRLDYGYYALLEQVGNLVGTIQSFQTLSTQSQQMLENFDGETTRLDEEIKSKIAAFKIGWDGREERVNSLEERGREAGRKAEELRRRLENVRVIVTNWENREDNSRRKWGRVRGGIGVGLLGLLIMLSFIAAWREWWFRGDPVKAGLSVPGTGSRNASLALGNGGVGDKRLRAVAETLPAEVRKVLEGIERRNKRGKGFYGTNAQAEVVADGEEMGCVSEDEKVAEQKKTEEVERQRQEDESRLRILDEL